MAYPVEVRQVGAQTTAVVRRRARSSELSRVVPQACGEVWSFIQSSGLPCAGGMTPLSLDGEINLEMGAEVGELFAVDGEVVCSSLPAGLAATTVHMGPYERLGEAHSAIRRWCTENGCALAGPN